MYREPAVIDMKFRIVRLRPAVVFVCAMRVMEMRQGGGDQNGRIRLVFAG